MDERERAKVVGGYVHDRRSALKHLAPSFAKKLVVDIDDRDVTSYQKVRLAERASGQTINIEVGCLRAVLKRTGLWARIQPNVEMLPERDDVGRALSADEEAALLAECGKSRSRILRPFVTLAIETAARYGTIRHLQWRNVDFANRCLTFGKDKTRAGTGRTIPLLPRALETLKFWAESFPGRLPRVLCFSV
jgi:integrase